MIDRRTKAGYKLRIYIDAIADAKKLTEEEWANQWALANTDGPYLTRDMWIEYLTECALKEAGMYVGSEAA